MPFSGARQAAVEAQTRSQSRRQLLGLSPYERHVRLLAEHTRLYGNSSSAARAAAAVPVLVSTDQDALRGAHRFLRSPEDEADTSWESRLAKRYYDRLYKEYAVADLSQYAAKRVGLRWRTEREVVAGKGQFSCGAKGCDAADGLATFEVPFAYAEAGEDKQALVKLRVCGPCAGKLHHGRGEQAADKRRKKRRRSPPPEPGAEAAHAAAAAPDDNNDDAAGLLAPLLM